MNQPVEAEYVVDPEDPRAPPAAVWERMTPAQRAAVVGSLPAGVPLAALPPEGDRHRRSKSSAADALEHFFRKTKRRAYVSAELSTYYPGEPRFCPDVLVVLDVSDHERQSWVVSDEGKGLDFVLEVFVDGDRKKDFELNVERFARLGIPEYFIFDQPRGKLLGYRLDPRGNQYERLLPQAGRIEARTLGLELTVEDGRVRFYYGTAPLLFVDELIGKLSRMTDELTSARDEALKQAQAEAERAQAEAERAQAEAERAEAEARRRAEAEDEVARLRAELDALKRS